MGKILPGKSLNVMLVATNFCRPDEARVPYGVSCLTNAFKTSGKNSGAIRTLVIDLNRFYQTGRGDFRIKYGKLAKKIATLILRSSCNVAAFSTFAWSDRLFSKTIAILSRHKKHPLIVVGGPMVIGTLGELQKCYPSADFFIESYGEKVFADLGAYLCGKERLVKDLPAFETLSSPYLDGEIPVRHGQAVRMELRRGCLFHCAFCRHRNLEKKVFCIGCRRTHVQELEFFKAHGVRKINVLDPFFNDRRKDFKALSMNFLSDVRRLGLDAEISLQIRPEMLDEDYLDEAQKMPNVIFEIGVQSLDDEVCRAIDRGAKNAVVIKKLSEVARRKIRTEITLIYGLPKQTATAFRRDLETLCNMGFEKVSAFPLQVYPGTKLYETYRDFGLEIKENALGILQVCGNPSGDFSEMEMLASAL